MAFSVFFAVEYHAYLHSIIIIIIIIAHVYMLHISEAGDCKVQQKKILLNFLTNNKITLKFVGSVRIIA